MMQNLVQGQTGQIKVHGGGLLWINLLSHRPHGMISFRLLWGHTKYKVR